MVDMVAEVEDTAVAAAGTVEAAADIAEVEDTPAADTPVQSGNTGGGNTQGHGQASGGNTGSGGHVLRWSWRRTPCRWRTPSRRWLLQGFFPGFGFMDQGQALDMNPATIPNTIGMGPFSKTTTIPLDATPAIPSVRIRWFCYLTRTGGEIDAVCPCGCHQWNQLLTEWPVLFDATGRITKTCQRSLLEHRIYTRKPGLAALRYRLISGRFKFKPSDTGIGLFETQDFPMGQSPEPSVPTPSPPSN